VGVPNGITLLAHVIGVHAYERLPQLDYEWTHLDTDGSGSLSVREILALVKRLNCNMPKREVGQEAVRRTLLLCAAQPTVCCGCGTHR